MTNFKNLSRYKIYRDGKVLDIQRNVEVKPSLNKDGYLTVTLRLKSGKRKTFRVHRLVAEKFIKNLGKLPEVNHKNGVKIDNFYKNLEWVTHAGNIQHAWNMGLLKSTKSRSEKISQANIGLHVGHKNGKAKAVYCITTKEYFKCMVYAELKYSVNKSQLSKCCNGHANSAGKHPKTGQPLKWKFIE